IKKLIYLRLKFFCSPKKPSTYHQVKPAFLGLTLIRLLCVLGLKTRRHFIFSAIYAEIGTCEQTQFRGIYIPNRKEIW
ncbi:hypothetical protein OAP82_11820, partial [Paracoccaceae bacterium]|nr:hypothetical protein [Paracoccaceae bacterium]